MVSGLLTFMVLLLSITIHGLLLLICVIFTAFGSFSRHPIIRDAAAVTHQMWDATLRFDPASDSYAPAACFNDALTVDVQLHFKLFFGIK